MVDELKDLRKVLLHEFKIFTGEAKPNVIRLLPALSLQKEQVDRFIGAIKQAIQQIKGSVADKVVSTVG